MAARSRDRDSAGRLLRVLQDCELFHIEAAIASLDSSQAGIRSESLIKPSRDEVNALGRTAQGRVLSLSDHKMVARLQAVLATVVNAYDGWNELADPESSWNLVCAVAGTAAMQAMRDCTASRTNCCIWGPQAKKLHVLLDWMVSFESATASSRNCIVRGLLLEWIQLTAEKQNQLAACLALFELLQSRRRRMATLMSGGGSTTLLDDRAGAFMDALRGIAERGTLSVTDSRRVKPSKLALIALETLALLCGDTAAHYMLLDESAKQVALCSEVVHKMVNGIRFFLATLRKWHFDSARREFLSYALQHLQSYVTICDTLLPTKKRNTGVVTTGVNSSAIAALDTMCWHWEATVPLLCTRSDASVRIRTNQPAAVFFRVLEKWSLSTLDPKTRFAQHSTSSEILYAQLRYVCLLMDLSGGGKGCLQAFTTSQAEMKLYFIFFFVKGLSRGIQNGDEAAVSFILNVLRSVLLSAAEFGLLATRNEEQEFLSQLLHLCDNEPASLDSSNMSTTWSQTQFELELFVADFIISRELFIMELVAILDDYRSSSIQNAISLVHTFIHQLDGATTQVPLYRHWRYQLAPLVLRLVDNENYNVCRLALSCLPLLPRVACIAELCKIGVRDTENLKLKLMLGYLFVTSSQQALESIASWFIDACQSGNLQTSKTSEVPDSPSDWNDYYTRANESLSEDDGRERVQERLLSLCFGINGWSKHVQLAKARRAVLRILLLKIFGSPRNPLLFRVLRQFVACNWVDQDVFEAIGGQLAMHMMNLARLSEDLLDDTSSSSTKATEGLLFSRLAPLLVLRMLPRERYDCITSLPCGREDLDHLNEYVDRHRYSDVSSSDTGMGVIGNCLFHILARSVVDPLEFKEVKMLATEILAKFRPPLVFPFVFAYLVAYLREATPHLEQDCSRIVDAKIIPGVCGLVTAKLMVYYLNRVFSEDTYVHNDIDSTSKALAVLVKIMRIPCVADSSSGTDESLLTDLQRGSIDCFALTLSRLSEDEWEQDNRKVTAESASSLLYLLILWIFRHTEEKDRSKEDSHDALGYRVQNLLESAWSEDWHGVLPLQVRICCCNVLLSAISRSSTNILASWKTQGVISRIALATASCSEDSVTAGGLQIIFQFMYKGSELLSMENNADLQLVQNCFEVTAARLESTQSEPVAMSGLKVVGAFIGKLPSFVGTLPEAEIQRLIDRCLVSLRDRRGSPAVSSLAQSLLQAMTTS